MSMILSFYEKRHLSYLISYLRFYKYREPALAMRKSQYLNFKMIIKGKRERITIDEHVWKC